MRDTTLIIGADVTHTGAGAKSGSPSIACVVGSIDSEFMNYPGSMRLQAGNTEIIEKENMVSMVEERIRAWQRHKPNKVLGSILFYCDGVSESQFDECKEIEIAAVEEAYRNVYDSASKLKLTFVIAGKRHHTRFYATKQNDTYKGRDPETGQFNTWNGNLRAGLLVEKVVTTPEQTNFYLQSHIAIKDTVRSAHYHILIDGMDLGTKLQDLTLMLCYAFPRATTGVSYVALAYIADRLCERGRAYLRRWSNNRGNYPSWQEPVDKDKKPLNEDELLKWKKDRAKDLAKDSNGPWKNFPPGYTPPPG